jgi:hypothetical protein
VSEQHRVDGSFIEHLLVSCTGLDCFLVALSFCYSSNHLIFYSVVSFCFYGVGATVLLHCDLKHAFTVLVELLYDFACLDVKLVFVCFNIGQVVLGHGLALNPIQ